MFGIGLDGAYADAIKRIQEQDENRSNLAMQALMWISRSVRPLRVDELCHALAVKTGSTHLNPDNVPSMNTILGCCLGLIAVDKEASTVRAIHFTLHMYLRGNSIAFSSPDGTMAEVCLTYLNLLSTKDPSEDTMKAPLLEYASYHWVTHARIETTDAAKSLAVTLLAQYDGHISARLLLLKICCEEWRHWYGNKPRHAGFSGLHVAAFLGNTEILTSLLKIKDWDTNGRDSMGRTPLIWAGMSGNTKVVQILLGLRGACMREKDHGGRTALSWAAESGH